MTQKQDNLLNQLMNAYAQNNPLLVPEKYRKYIIEKIKEKYIEYSPIMLKTDEDVILDNFERYVETTKRCKY